MTREYLMARDLAERRMAMELIQRALVRAKAMPESQRSQDNLDSILHVLILEEMTAFKVRITSQCTSVAIEAAEEFGIKI